MTESHPYLHEVAPDPLDEKVPPTLDNFLRYLATRGCILASQSIDLLPRSRARHEISDDEFRAEMDRYLANFYQFSGDFNLYLALTTLAKHSPEDAEEVAARIIDAYEGGDSYGEWLWEWTTDHGIDPERLIAEHDASKAAKA